MPGPDSGVKIGDDVLALYEELKGTNSKDAKLYDQVLKSVGFKISKNYESVVIDESLISFPSQDFSKNSVVDYNLERDDWKTFCEALPPTECRFGIFDLYYNMKPGDGSRKKIVLIAWSPDVAKIKDKMLFSTTKDSLKKKLVGIADECQATETDELELISIIVKISKGFGVYDQ